MSYQALYRKYRPKDFSDVKGQDHIVKTLTNEIQGDRIGHAYLFCGTRGTGKTTIAKIFAKAVNCQNPGPQGPCGKCPMCRGIEEQTSMNVVEMDAASHNGVDDIRGLIDEIQYSPTEGKYKVYIIDEVHMLSKPAFNALLKTLEEPPSYVIFILATTEYFKIPVTILSRCQRYDFKRIGVETIMGRLAELLDREGVEAEPKALRYVARQADGALRDGLSLLEQCVSFYFGEKLTYEKVLKILGAVDTDMYQELLRALIHGRVTDAIQLVASLVERGKDLSQFVEEFIWFLRNVLIVMTAEDVTDLVDLPEETILAIQEMTGDLEEEIIFRYIRLLSALVNDMKYSNNKRVDLEVMLIRLCRPQMERDYEALLDRMNHIEQISDDLQVALEGGTLSVAAGGERPLEAPEPVRKILPEAVPEDVRAVVANWNHVKSRVCAVTRTMLEHTKLTVGDDGILLMAEVVDVNADYLNKDVVKQEIIDAAAELTGKEIQVKVVHVESRRELNALPELRQIIKGVDINIED
ncbi:MAG: DNA polymerase III subunit gamma/tau [Eubacterium sp.]|nr:DNA polymerase III subunit gamma/tau [Eubacterium sp.]